ncbi:MAG TPA: hypothetical protein DEA08_22455 [Planctomycetes bacterium]|nr:hypothetical protein [Planctomycetota bacterium]
MHSPFKPIVDVQAAAARARALVIWGRGEAAARRELALAGVESVQAERLLRGLLAERAQAIRAKGMRQIGYGLLLFGVAAFLAWLTWAGAHGPVRRPPVQALVVTLLAATLTCGAGAAKLWFGAAHDGSA